MVYFLASATRRQYFAIPFALVAGLATPMVLLSAPKAVANDYETCANALIEAGLDGEAAAGACGKALNPADLSSCTLDVTGFGDINAEQALLACQSDRRPKELATCVGDIHQSLEVANSTAVLNSCRRSVLPLRYADCVVGVAAAADLAIADSLLQCSAAGYIPTDVAPTFIFAPQYSGAEPECPPTFTLEQITQLHALACAPPEQQGRPISCWSRFELADGLMKRGIVETISPRHVGPLLAKAALKSHQTRYWLHPPQPLRLQSGSPQSQDPRLRGLLQSRLPSPLNWNYTDKPLTS